MFKTVGISVVIAASAVAAFVNTRISKKKVAVNEGMLELIRFIRARIFYFRDPLDAIYEEFDDTALASCGFTDALTSGGFVGSLEEGGVSRYLDDDTVVKLKAFGGKLGKTPADEQVANCDLCIELLEKKVEQLKAELPIKSRMYSTLCIVAGLGAALLLI